MFSAFWAASMTSVPEPQKGSCTRLSRRTLPKSAIAAASVSLMGASVALRRYPRLCRPSPEVSSMTSTTFLRMANRILYSAPVSGSVAVLCPACKRLTTAFLTMLWQAGTLDS